MQKRLSAEQAVRPIGPYVFQHPVILPFARSKHFWTLFFSLYFLYLFKSMNSMRQNMHKIDLFTKYTSFHNKNSLKNATCIQKSTLKSNVRTQIPPLFGRTASQGLIFCFFFSPLLQKNPSFVSFSIQNKKIILFQKQYRAIMEKTFPSDFITQGKDAYKTIHNPYESYIVF